jgi:cytochrome c
VVTTVSDAPFNKTGDGPTLNALTSGTMGADHPVTWCKDYRGGRSYYTNHGASAAAWDDANIAKELLGAITWAAGQSDPVYSDCGATVLANYQQSFVAAPPNLSEPIGFDVLPDGSGRVIQTDRRGGVRLHDPATNSTTLLATSRSTPPTRTEATGLRSTTTSPRTGGCTSSTHRRPSRT